MYGQYLPTILKLMTHSFTPSWLLKTTKQQWGNYSYHTYQACDQQMTETNSIIYDCTSAILHQDKRTVNFLANFPGKP